MRNRLARTARRLLTLLPPHPLPVAAILKTVSADAASEAGHEAIAAALPADSPLHFLVNNAGVGVPDRIKDMSRHDFEEALAINVTGPLFLTQKLLPRLRKASGQARVLNVGSGVADNVQVCGHAQRGQQLLRAGARSGLLTCGAWRTRARAHAHSRERARMVSAKRPCITDPPNGRSKS